MVCTFTRTLFTLSTGVGLYTFLAAGEIVETGGGLETGRRVVKPYRVFCVLEQSVRIDRNSRIFFQITSHFRRI